MNRTLQLVISHLPYAGGALSRSEILKRLRASLKHEGDSQVPQLEGPTAARKKKLLE